MHLYIHSHVHTHTERKVLGQKNIKDFKFLLRKSDLILVFYQWCCPVWSHFLYLSLNRWQLVETSVACFAWYMVSLCSSWTLFVDQIGLEFQSACISLWELGLKTCATCLIVFVCLGLLLLPLLVGLVGLVLVSGLKPKNSKFSPNIFVRVPWPSLLWYVSCLAFNLAWKSKTLV